MTTFSRTAQCLAALTLAGCTLDTVEPDREEPDRTRDGPGAADGFGAADDRNELSSAPPPGFVDLAEALPGLRLDVRYAGER